MPNPTGINQYTGRAGVASDAARKASARADERMSLSNPRTEAGSRVAKYGLLHEAAFTAHRAASEAHREAARAVTNTGSPSSLGPGQAVRDQHLNLAMYHDSEARRHEGIADRADRMDREDKRAVLQHHEHGAAAAEAARQAAHTKGR